MRLLPLLLLSACTAAEGTPRGTASSTEGPIVLELFTSQGCSSCPPADRILDKLAATGLEGATLAPLAFHVDYWDDLGWPDPYASPAWSERQRDYARALGEGRVYTPQLVVGGRTGMVGSNLVAISAAVGRTPRPALLTATASWAPASVELAATAPDGADVLVALYEDATATKVPRGENAGETLKGDRVVRRLERVAMAGAKGSVTIKLDPSWRIAGAVMFAQRADKSIVASRLLPR
jgi:hypothetical protein